MGLRGPKALPTELKKQRGTYQKCRSSANEPVSLGTPATPKWLNDDAKKEYKRLVGLLSDMKVLGKIDEYALTRYATTWVRWRWAIQQIQTLGDVSVYKSEDGTVKSVQPNGYSAIARSLAEELTKLEQAFGMTPSARSRIEVAPAPNSSTAQDKSRFFKPQFSTPPDQDQSTGAV